MGLLKFMPARASKKADTEVVADLDEIVATNKAFVLHGRTHILKPITVKEYGFYSNSYAKLLMMHKKESLSSAEAIEGYYELFSSMCETITLKDVEAMTVPQCGALFQLLADSISGRVFKNRSASKVEISEDEKKKMTSQPPSKA